jgi:peptide/nickel transport system permease protein
MESKHSRAEVSFEFGQRETKVRTYNQIVISQFARHRLAVFGLVLLVALVVAVVVGPIVTPFDPYEVSGDETLLVPSLRHPMGTDDLGRDQVSRMLSGGRVSMGLGLIATAVSMLVGCAIGGTAGFYGGAVDNLLMRITDTVLCFPWLFTMMVFSVVFGKGFVTIAIAVGLLAWTTIARIVRASFLSLREEDFVLAARSLGAKNSSIMLRHMLPNTMGPILVAATLLVGQAIIYESALSFLGLGVQLPAASWGSMLNLAQDQLRYAPWMMMYPGMMIFLCVMGINLVGDGLRDALDPRHAVK